MTERVERVQEESDFTKLLCGEFRPSTEKMALRELAKQYHDSCESYDYSVCSFINDHGVGIPTTPRELQLVNKNALTVRKQILSANPGVTGEDLRKAIQSYSREIANT